MRVVVLPADETACGQFRCIFPARMLQAEHPDWTVEIYKPGSVQGSTDGHGRLHAVRGLDLDGIDLAIMQRVGTRTSLELARAIQYRGGAVVLDADDALWAIHKDNAAHRSWNHPASHTHWSVMDQAAKEADLVTVTTPRLADRYGKHGRVAVIPNRLPSEAVGLTSIREPDQSVTFGWSGFVATHPADLHVMGDSVHRILMDLPDVQAQIVGDPRGIAEAWELDLTQVNERISATGAVKFHNYFTALTLLDVGVVPLEDSTFNRCKSGLKASEMAAQGIPSVVTPTPAHRELIREGYPLLWAETPRRWFEALHRLLADPEERERRATDSLGAARAHVMENHIGEWSEAWTRAAVRRGRMATTVK